MAEIRKYRYPAQKKYRLKNGQVRSCKNEAGRNYVCKLHHPSAEEMKEIRDELAAGVMRKDVMTRHNIGTYERLARLLKKFSAEEQMGGTEDGPIDEPTDLADAEDKTE